MQKDWWSIKKIQSIWACILQPIINISACFLANPWQENITYIAYGNHHFFFVFVWAFSCAAYLYGYTRLFMRQIHCQKKFAHSVLTLSCSGMLLSVCIPYSLDQTQFLSKLHVNMAMFATVLYIILLFYILYHCYFYEHTLCMKLLPVATVFIGSLACFFLLMGAVNTILEILFVLGMSFYLYWIQVVYRSNP